MPQKTVLIVEDDAIVAVHLGNILTSLGYKVAAPVATGELAIAAAIDAPPDLIMMDIELAGKIDGVTAAGRIKATVDVPIIFLTSYLQDALLKRAKTTLPYGYLIKPVSQRELMVTIEMAFHRHLVDRQLKEKEAILRESEARLAEAQAVAKVGSWQTELSTLKAIWSKEIYRIFEIDPDSFQPSHPSFLAFVHPEDRGKVDTAFTESLDKQAHNAIEHRIITSGGLIKFVEERWRVFGDDDGRPVRAMGTCQDITERHQEEEEKAKLEAQNRQLQKAKSLGLMAGAIAHHFNNQLGAVIGNLEMVLEDLPQDSAPVKKLTLAMRAAHKAAEVSSQMLAYLGQTTGIHVPLDLSEACRRSLPLLQVADSQGRILKIDFPSPGPTISANANQIQQILTNLVTNAREAVDDNKGVVSLTVKAVSPGDIEAAHRFPSNWQPQHETYACLEVRDNGCGIAGDDIDKLFDPFFSSKFAGRGLGLSVVLGLAKAHNGAVTVESDVGQGSTLRVYLPVSAEEIPEQQAEVTHPVAAKGSGTILLVEDEELLRDMTASMLTRLGYTVLEAKNGALAVEMFGQHQDEIRCVLSDLTMPCLDGWETLTALRQLSPGIPVILASGHDEARVKEGDHPELPQVFLHKPYTREELEAALAKALDGK